MTPTSRALLLACGGLLLLSDAQANPAKVFRWDIPDPVMYVGVPEVVEAHGIPMRLEAVKSRRSLEFLLQHFATSFERAGLYIAPTSHQPQLSAHPQLTGLDPERLVAYTVILQANRDRTTTVIIGEAEMGQRRPPVADAFAPLFPRSEHVLQSRLEGMKAVTYVARGTRKEVLAFYRQVLGRAGYVEREPGVFQADREVLQVTVTPQEDGASSVMVWAKESLAKGPSAPASPR